jgi:acyl transferase domain-containing protein
MSTTSDGYRHLPPLQRAFLALEAMQAKLDTLERQRTEAIAIVGMGCRFPGGADDPESFWQVLQNGIDTVQAVPDQRWASSAQPNGQQSTAAHGVNSGSFLQSDIDGCDVEFFGIAPREAARLDPQQRLLLEVSWEALEQAGIAPDALVGSKSGVFVGINNCDYSQLQLQGDLPLDAYFFTGSTFSVAAGRLAYNLGLQGPALAVDTSCSSSLVAVHLACQSLRTGECRLALAGGVNLMLSPHPALILSQMQALAADGRCKTFDASADGYGRGEGCGIVVLKRLSDAIADRDPILALIRGSAVNHDGHSSGLTVPNGLAQQAVIQDALHNANVDPSQVSYVEVHGTGTRLGDPLEIEAIATVFGTKRLAPQPLILGSVKTNIGHLEAAAGIASLIKVVLALQHREIPPHLHLKTPNPLIPWAQFPVAIATELTPWTIAQKSRLAGISSFGMSGTNAHLIVEEAPADSLGISSQPTLLHPVERPFHILTISAKSKAALKALVQRYQAVLPQLAESDLGNVCFTANIGRSHFAYRMAVVSDTLPDLCQQLHRIDEPDEEQRLSYTSRKPKIAFLFTGQGSQFIAMGHQLYETHATVRHTLDHCDALLRPYLETPLLEVLYARHSTHATAQSTLLDQTAYTQPALFALEYALAQLWRSWGVEPDVVMGHSVGEYVAACIAGVFSLEDGLKLMAKRGRLMQALPAGGGMAAVFASATRVAAAIAPYAGQIAIAAINGPTNTVISGSNPVIQTLLQKLEIEGILAAPLQVSHGFHSPLMEPMVDAFKQVATDIGYAPPCIPLISNLTGKPVENGEITQAAYWCRHVREPVQFLASMQLLQAQGYTTFLEIGPHPILLGMARRFWPDGAGIWLPSLQHGQSDWRSLLTSLGRLYEQGSPIDWSGFEQGYVRHRVPLPTYPFQRSRHWIAVTNANHRDQNTENQKSSSANLERDDWLYQIEWQAKPGEKLEFTSSPNPATWLILADQGGVGASLASQLEHRGQTCILIYAGAADESVTEPHQWIDPAQPTAFQRLVQEITATYEHPCRGIVYLWSLDSAAIATTNSDSLQADQIRNCGGLLHLTQALTVSSLGSQPRLWVVTQSAQAVPVLTRSLSVAQAPVLGLGRAIALEHPELWGGCIDLDADMSVEAATATLLAELGQSYPEAEVAFRSGQRYLPRLQPSQSQSVGTSPLSDHSEAEAQRSLFKSDCTYLITGGLGGLGCQIAHWMVSQGAQNLVLVGRKGVSEHDSLHELEQAGATVTILLADVALADQVAHVLAQIARSHPPLAGVIHLAGVLDDGILSKQTWERFATVMAPKVNGAWHLHTQTLDLPLDFFVLFSSVASLLGSPGQSNYAAANAFLDALAHHRRSQGLSALSLNWSPWSERGMAAALGNRATLRWATLGVQMIKPEQGLQTLASLLRQTTAQMGVLPVDWSRFFEQWEVGDRSVLSAIADQNHVSQTSGTQLNPAGHDLLQRLQNVPPHQRQMLLITDLQTIVASVLGVESPHTLDPQLGFFEMGMDSLMTLDLKNQLQTRLGTSLPSTLTFEYPTLADLAVYLLRDVIALASVVNPDANLQHENREAADRLAAIQHCSEAELSTFIDQELAALRGG